jgi:hypothetical protein
LASGPELFTRLFVYWHDATRSMHADRTRRSAGFVSACWNGAANGEKRAGGSRMIANIREKHGTAQLS